MLGSSSGLGHRPLTAGTGVRLPYRVPKKALISGLFACRKSGFQPLFRHAERADAPPFRSAKLYLSSQNPLPLVRKRPKIFFQNLGAQRSRSIRFPIRASSQGTDALKFSTHMFRIARFRKFFHRDGRRHRFRCFCDLARKQREFLQKTRHFDVISKRAHSI